jgi:hypothetical protein
MLQNGAMFADMHRAVDLPGTLNRYTHNAVVAITKHRYGGGEFLHSAQRGVEVFELISAFVRPQINTEEMAQIEAARAQMASSSSADSTPRTVALPTQTEAMLGDTPYLTEVIGETLEYYLDEQWQVRVAMGAAAYAQLIRMRSDDLLAQVA